MTNRRRRPTRKPKTPIPGFPGDGLPEDMLLACYDLIRRTGAKSIETRYSEPETKGSPVVWLAIAEYVRGRESRFAVHAALTPGQAIFKLLEDLVDGGRCQHCEKPTGVTELFIGMPMPETFCWYQYDPELKKFRRGCE